MSEKKSLVQAMARRDEAIAEEIENRGVLLANLGQVLKNAGEAVVLPEDSVAEVDKAAGEIRRLEDGLRTLLADDEKKSELQEERKTLNVELRNIRNKEENVLEELGRAAWDLWKAGRQPDERMAEALEDLVKAEQRLHAAEDAIQRSEQDSEARGPRLLSRGRSLFLAGRRRTASAAVDRHWGQAGSRVRELIPAEAFGDTPAAVPLSTLAALEERQAEIQSRLDAIAVEKEAVDASIEEAPGKGGVKKRAASIESALEDQQSVLDEAYRNLSESWLAGSPESPPGDAVRLTKDLKAVDRRIAALEAEKAALNAHLELLDAEKEQARLAERVEKLEEDIKELQKSLKGARKELTAAAKDVESRRAELPERPPEE